MIKKSLLVLSPAQDIGLKILSLRSDILSGYGFASAMAFPAMIPLCSVPAEIKDSRVKKALHSNTFSGFHISTSKIVDVKGSLFLAVKETKLFSLLKNQCHDIRNLLLKDRDQPPEFNIEENDYFPLFNGFFLAQNESKIPEKEITEKIIPPLLDFHHFAIVLLKINFYAEISSWWENIDWEIPFEVKNKKH